MDPPPPAPLPDELIEEIFLRIPPSDPATLARAAVAQKRWCRLAAGPGFRRRYRDRHRAPPMLGFFCDPWDDDDDSVFFSTIFVPASSFQPKPRADHPLMVPLDAHHGRILLRSGKRFVVWDPITGHRVALRRPKGLCVEWKWKTTVLCAAPAGSCDHLDCHRGHFTVVLIGDYPDGMLSCVYSSQAGSWSEIAFAQHLGGACRLGDAFVKRSALVGNALYSMLGWGNKILKYDLGTREFSVMEPPPLLSCESFTCSDEIELSTMEDGQLGLAVVRESALYILSTDEQFGWERTKIIGLEKCGNYEPFLIGFAGDIGLVFIDAAIEILSIDIRSAEVKVVYKGPRFLHIVPYVNFWTPVMGLRKTKKRNWSGCLKSLAVMCGEQASSEAEIV